MCVIMMWKLFFLSHDVTSWGLKSRGSSSSRADLSICSYRERAVLPENNGTCAPIPVQYRYKILLSVSFQIWSKLSVRNLDSTPRGHSRLAHRCAHTRYSPSDANLRRRIYLSEVTITNETMPMREMETSDNNFVGNIERGAQLWERCSAFKRELVLKSRLSPEYIYSRDTIYRINTQNFIESFFFREGWLRSITSTSSNTTVNVSPSSTLSPWHSPKGKTLLLDFYLFLNVPRFYRSPFLR